jgi:hypothetical protein
LSRKIVIVGEPHEENVFVLLLSFIEIGSVPPSARGPSEISLLLSFSMRFRAILDERGNSESPTKLAVLLDLVRI